MNLQNGNQRLSRDPACYNQPNPINTYNSYGLQTGQGINKGFNQMPYGNTNIQNGLTQTPLGQMHNQNYQAQLSVPPVPPSNIAMNQMSSDFNSMHLTQNQNHHLLTNNQPPQFPVQLQPPSGPITNSQVHHYQPQPPKLLQNPGILQQKPAVPYPSNVNNPAPLPLSGSMPFSQMNNSSPMPPQSSNFPLPTSHHSNAYSSTLPPPPQNVSSSSMHMQQNNSYAPNMPQQENFPLMKQNSAYPSRVLPQNTYASSAMPVPQDNHTNALYHGNSQGALSCDTYSPEEHQYGRSTPLANGSSHPGYAQNSNMHARYPPPPSPSKSPGGNYPPSSAGSQYMQYNNSAHSQASHMGSQPPSAKSRLDPDHMPSPIQVIEEDRKLHSSYFSTSQRGLVPPLVTTNFEVVDQGHCSPRFIRSTIYSVPTTSDMLKQTSVPFALAISPFAQTRDGEQPPVLIDPGEGNPVRCHRCRAYMSPFMQFIDAGRRFQCMLCKATTEVPAEYFTHLDHMGQRADKFQRPELCLGSYEFIVNKDYCKEGKFPNCPAFIFLIDVSYNSIRSGMVKTLCDNMRNILDNLPSEEDTDKSKMKVGFITYSSVVHFYNINNNLAQPQMLVVSDVNDMFMPLLDGFLIQPSEASAIIDSLMEQIPAMFAETKETETILGPAIQAGLEALKAAECSGKLFVFHSTLPISEAPGKLKNRDDRKLLGTEKEKTVLSPQTTFYNNLGQECVKAGCSVDLFLFNNAYIDVATLGQICRLTGGQLYKYTYFQSDIDGSRFLEDLRRNVQKPIAFDAVLRVRTSTGIRPTDFHGSFFMSNTTDVELASITSDSSLNIEIKYDDKLTEEDGVCIQCAVLYTSCGGQRRLRVHNLALNTCSQMADLFRNCELDTMLNYFLKDGIRRVTEETPKQIKELYVSRSAQILACYRKNCAQASSAGQLILPECTKLLPLYINCLIKCDALSGGQEMNVDDRSFIMLAALSMDVDSSQAYLYPRLLPLHDAKPDLENFELPVAIRCSFERIKEHDIYVIENGLYMLLWVDLHADPEWVQSVFGVNSASKINVEKNELLPLNTQMSRWVHQVIDELQSQRQRHMKLYIARPGDKAEYLFRILLVEDNTSDSSESYVDFLCHLHKEIRLLLS